jgi:hypothetical protein
LQKARQITARVLKAIMIALAAVMLFFAAAALIISYPQVQSRIVNYLISKLEQRTGLQASLGSVSLNYKGLLQLNDFLVLDTQADTLAHIGRLETSLDFFNIYSTRLLVSKVKLTDPYFSLSYTKEGRLNLALVIELLRSKDKPKASKPDFYMKVYGLELTGGRFGFQCSNLGPDNSMRTICPSSISQLSLEARNVVIDGSDIFFDIDKLSLYDSGRLGQVGLRTSGSIRRGIIDLEPVHISTSRSEIALDYFFMGAGSFTDYKLFNSKVFMKSAIKYASVAMADIGGFAPYFSESHDVAVLKGVFTGTVSDFKLRGINLHLTDSTFYSGDADFMGVTEPQSMFFHISADSSNFFVKDISSSHILGKLELDDILSGSGLSFIKSAGYKGSLTGYLSEFVVAGTLSSPAGYIEADALLSMPAPGSFLCSGKLHADMRDLSIAFPDLGWLGELSAVSQINLDINNGKLQSLNIDAGIAAIEAAGYQYSEIYIGADYSSKGLGFSFFADDPYLKADIAGSAVFTGSTADYMFTAVAERLSLGPLGLAPVSDSIELSFSGAGSGKIIPGLYESLVLEFSNINISSRLGEIEENKLMLQFTRDQAAVYAQLLSRYGNASVQGRFVPKDMALHLGNIAKELFPSSLGSEPIEKLGAPVNAHARFFTDSLGVILKVAGIDSVEAAPGLNIEAELDSRSNSASLTCHIPSLNISGNALASPRLQAQLEGGILSGSLIADMPMKNRNFLGTTFIFSAGRDSIEGALSWRADSKEMYSGSIKAEADIALQGGTGNYSACIYVQPWELMVADTLYNFSGTGFMLSSGILELAGLRVQSGGASLFIDGVASGSPLDTVNIKASRFEVAGLNRLLEKYNIELQGRLSGSAKIASSFTDPIIEASAQIDTCIFNGVSFGALSLGSQWEQHQNALRFWAQSYLPGHSRLGCTGSYGLQDKHLELDVNIDSLDITFIHPFLEDIMEVSGGWIEGRGRITGHLPDIGSRGAFIAHSLNVSPYYLNTFYEVGGPLSFNEGKLEFQGMSIKDKRGGTGQLDGYFSLFALPEIDYQIIISANSLSSLNTANTDNDMFYGRAAANASVKIEGRKNLMQVNVAAELVKNSKLHIPISSAPGAGTESLLRFSSDAPENIEQEAASAAFISDIEVRLGADTEVQLIMDEQYGDIIKLWGNGGIAISTNNAGETRFLGEYLIADGEYLFTMRNLINKRFRIMQGSSVNFGGALGDARVDIRALYTTKAAVKPIMGADSSAAYNRRTQVECMLHLTGYLYSPDIKFSISLPDQPSKVQDRLMSLTEDELNRQFLSMIVFNRFIEMEGTNAGAYATAGDGYANSMEVLSNQLSNWLSAISRDFDIGVNYRPGSETTADELNVGLSTQIFNDRLIIDYSRSASFGEDHREAQVQEANIGDVTVEVKLTKDGRLRMRGFSRSGYSDPLNETGASTNGIGISFTDEFGSFAELFGRGKKRRQQREEQEADKGDAIRNDDD